VTRLPKPPGLFHNAFGLLRELLALAFRAVILVVDFSGVIKSTKSDYRPMIPSLNRKIFFEKKYHSDILSYV